MASAGEAEEKDIEWMGSSYDDLCSFPKAAKRQGGHELNEVCHGRQPSDWKPMSTVGPGAMEIRFAMNEGGGEVQFRVISVAKFPEAVYVLHAFEKKTQRTSKHDIQVAMRCYKEIARERLALRKQKRK